MDSRRPVHVIGINPVPCPHGLIDAFRAQLFLFFHNPFPKYHAKFLNAIGHGIAVAFMSNTENKEIKDRRNQFSIPREPLSTIPASVRVFVKKLGRRE